MEWETASVADCLAPLSFAAKTKIQSRDYKQSGRFPIIDQGQDQIAGWTDDENAVIDEPLPLIVFGDHTRALKFVDFPFARGADGTQILKPKPEVDPLYFFYACRAIDLPSRGYNRHFSILKQKDISLPPRREEQQSIGNVLRLVEQALGGQTASIQGTEALKLRALHDLFTRGVHNEPQKATEIGSVPQSWLVESISTHHSVVSGGTPSRANPLFWHAGTIPWVKTTEVNYSLISETEEHITSVGLQESAARMLPVGTLLLAMYGQGVTRGKVAILGIEAACNQACAAIRPTDEAIQPKYLYHFLTSRYDAIRQLAHGGQQQNLNLEILRDLPIAFPSDGEEQKTIVGILDVIDRKIDLHKERKSVLEKLFEALLHKLLSGEILVTDLDLSAIARESV